jgi:trehalose 6-phosphate synthase
MSSPFRAQSSSELVGRGDHSHAHLGYGAVADDIEVVLASNRGPVSFRSTKEGFVIERGAGGLAGALDPVARRLGQQAIWIATATSKADREAVASGAADNLESLLGYRLDLLRFDPDIYSAYYNTVSNRMLWFANHCLWDELGIEQFGNRELSAWRRAYEPVNRRFADVVKATGSKDSIVLFQDYHLTLAPAYLKQDRPDQTILHFTHSSFCGPRGLQRLPGQISTQVIDGMLGADLIGFHVAPWIDGFLDSCEAIGANVDRELVFVERGERRSWVREYPIEIDTSDIRARAAGRKARRWADRFKSSGRRLIVRADRTDPSKNVVRGFEAFGLLLDRRKDLRNELQFVACLYPSRLAMREYRQHMESIRERVDAINARHPNSIVLFLKNDYERTLGALLVYDVLLVNPIMDGMNLVSKEGPAVNETSGAVVLTVTAGSFEALGEDCIAVNDALDVEETADALERALEMPEDERARRAANLRAKVESRTPEDWIEAQLDDLNAVKLGGEPKTPARP